MKAASVRVVSRRTQIENGSVFSVRQAAAACNVSPPVVRRWLSLGLLSAPPWTVEPPMRRPMQATATNLVLAKPNVIINDIRLRGLAVAGSDADSDPDE